MSKYSLDDLRVRACRRAALALHSYWEEGSGAHTRLFETLVPDEYVVSGVSIKGGWYREHVVPCKVIRDHCFELCAQGASVEDVAAFIQAHLKIVFITPEEAEHLNVRMKLKTKMPAGWAVGDDVMARLAAAGISITNTRT